jgi:hypothetical protein
MSQIIYEDSKILVYKYQKQNIIPNVYHKYGAEGDRILNCEEIYNSCCMNTIGAIGDDNDCFDCFDKYGYFNGIKCNISKNKTLEQDDMEKWKPYNGNNGLLITLPQ